MASPFLAALRSPQGLEGRVVFRPEGREAKQGHGWPAPRKTAGPEPTQDVTSSALPEDRERAFHVRWQRRLEPHAFARHWVIDFQCRCMQRLPFEQRWTVG